MEYYNEMQQTMVFTIPASTAMCEHDLRAMKEIKSDQRSSLTAVSLDSLMILEVESTSIDNFEPTKAIELWINEANPRPGQEDHSKNISVNTVTI